jgi:ATPase subunit of ABC transporter with duplicated ATPase domains
MSIIVSGVSYCFHNGAPLFSPVSFTVSDGQKASLIGDNGSGKSTLLRIIAGELSPASGTVSHDGSLYYVPQLCSTHFGTIADALGVGEKLRALHAILNGATDETLYDALEDDWNIEEECRQALDYWRLDDKSPETPFDELSGGEKTKVLLAGIQLHQPSAVLLDEPTNHLDLSARRQLYQWVQSTKTTLLVVSHDEELLRLMEVTMELSATGLRTFGGNYEGFASIKETESKALQQQIASGWASLKAAKRKAQEVSERQERRSSQGNRNHQKGGQARILLNAKSSEAQATASKLNKRHQDKINEALKHIQELKARQQPTAHLKVDIKDAQLHKGKILIEARGVNFSYDGGKDLWTRGIDLTLASGDRWWITGDNGSGKTTLLRLLLGQAVPTKGTVRRAAPSLRFHYLDQEYREVMKPLTVKQMAEQYNRRHLPDNEVCLLLSRSLFPPDSWDCPCLSLSGGERMRLFLCCMTIADQAPDVLIFDEPTNNLDLRSIGILTETLENYHGTLILVSHDVNFIRRMNVNKTLRLNDYR